MRQFLENLFSVAAIVGTEAWFLEGYFASRPEFEPAIAFVAAVGFLLAKGPFKSRFLTNTSSRSHDQTLFQEFLRAFPTSPTIHLLRNHDFGDSFSKDAIAPLFEFDATWGSVEKEFLDKTLEKKRKAFFALARELTIEFAQRTVPVRAPGHLSVFSDQLRRADLPRPPHVIEDARVLNEKSSAFVREYEDFVRLCRTRLVR